MLGGRYELVRRILSGDAKRGIPELWQANSYGDVHYARVWPRTSQEDFELRALWNREVRSLTRLHGYPGATNLFVRLQDLGVTADYYYAILAGGQYQLLRELLGQRQRHPWLQNLAELNRRRQIWEGLLRVAEGLSILHGEGTLHRSLSPSSIFCAPEGQGNFRLSGFEWSLRIAGREGGAAKVAQKNPLQAKELDNSAGEYSTATDWFDFGMVAAELFGAPVQTTRKRETIREAIAKHGYLRESERELIAGLLNDDPEVRTASGPTVTQQMRDILRDLGAVTMAAGRPLILALRLEGDTTLSQAVEKASGRKAGSSDPEAQTTWIEKDLQGDLRVLARTGPTPHFILRGTKLSYKVKAWLSGGQTTWDLGFCEQVEEVPQTLDDDQILGLAERRLEILSFPYARKHLQSLRDRSAPWDRTLPFRAKPSQLSQELQDVWDFFKITQQIETVLTVAQICPVRVIEHEVTSSDTFLTVTPQDEASRSELAQHLMLPPPSEQLKDWLRLGAETVTSDDEEEPSKDKWSFLDRRAVTQDLRSVPVWRFVGAQPHPQGPRYMFQTEGSLPPRSDVLYLARNYGGTIRQLRRRNKAIEDLRSHEGLLRLLADPAGASQRSDDPLPEPRHAIPLDGSKVAALEAVWRTQPSFALQGPPGTGKTTLIQAFVDRLLHDDASAQVLITAHSHHTVDDVMAKLVKLFSDVTGAEQPIILRLGAKEDDPQAASALTARLLEGMKDSAIVATAPQHLKDRYRAVASRSNQSDDVNLERRTLQTLVQDSANVTCATSNDGELADLTTRGRRFDWSIIEEAGKAHGFDMAVALQESHRLLLIGDHKQLPPFNSKTFKDLLADVQRIRSAVQVGAQFAPTLIDASIIEEAEGRDSLEERCGRWRRMVAFFEQFFERSSSAESGSGPAATLTDQHRMHPHIADLVGRIFYPSPNGGTILNTPEETRERFEGDPPFELLEGGSLPPERIVWLDVPWVQRDAYAKGETEGLFTSQPEVDAVMQALHAIRARDDKVCEVQILSPYNDQLAAIRSQLERDKTGIQLQHMFEPPFNLHEGKRIGATVDEFQGSEADVVIVSLVRNNGLVPWKSVGFLKVANRMNVLLSRARHKLIIVGSWDFFESRCDEHTAPDAEYAYIQRMMTEMARARTAGGLARVGAGR